MPLESLSHDELKSLLEENLKIARENQTAIKKIRRHLLIGSVAHFLKLVIIVALTVAGYIYISPYLQESLKTFNEISGMTKSLGPWQDLLQNIPR